MESPNKNLPAGKEGKSAFERFRERHFRERFFVFVAAIIIWFVIIALIPSGSSSKKTAYNLQGYWIASAFFIFAAWTICFKRER